MKTSVMKGVAMIWLVICMMLSSCGGQSTESAWQEQYDLGIRYLSDGNYEEAIIAFTAAIEIDPKRAETYEGLANAYIAAGDEDAALAILEEGYEMTQDIALLTFLEEMRANMESAFRNRFGYVAFDELSASRQDYILSLMDAVISQENETAWGLLQSDVSNATWYSDMMQFILNMIIFAYASPSTAEMLLGVELKCGRSPEPGIIVQAPFQRMKVFLEAMTAPWELDSAITGTGMALINCI